MCILQNATLLTDQIGADPTREMIGDTTGMKDRLRDSKLIIEGTDLVSSMMIDLMIKQRNRRVSKLWVECALGKRKTMKRLTNRCSLKLALIIPNLSKKTKAGSRTTDLKECQAMKAQKENQQSKTGLNLEKQETMTQGTSRKIKIRESRIRRLKSDRVPDLSRKIQDVGFTISLTSINENAIDQRQTL